MKPYLKRNTSLPYTLLITSCFTLLTPVAVATDFTIIDGQTVTAGQTLNNNEAGIIESGGSLDVTDSTAIVATGNNVTVTSSGTIKTGGMTTNSFGIDSSGSDASITNSGSISTETNYSYGINSSGANASITNSGSILTEGFSHGIDSVGANATITNSGSISTENYSSFGIHVNGADATITNSGSISTLFSDGIHIVAGGTNATVTNSGTISAGGTGIQVAGGGTAIIINSGTISTHGVPGYGVQITGAPIKSTIINSGTISTTQVASHGINGAGANNLTIINSGTISTLLSSGINAYGAGLTIINTGSISTQGDNSSAILTYASDAIINNSGLLSATGLNSFAVSSFASQDTTLNLLPGSQIIGTINLGDTNDNDTVNIYGGSLSANLTIENTENINLLGAGVVIGNTVITIDGTGESTREVALSQFTSSVHNLISQRMTYSTPLKPVQVAALTLSPGMFFEERKPFAWAQAFGGKLERDAKGAALAFDSRHKGINFGYEWDVNETRVGLVGGIVNAETESQTASFETEIDSYYIGAYSHLKLGMLNLTTSLIGGFSESDNKRVVIDNVNGAEVAESDVNSTFISPAISLGAAFKATKTIELRPSFNANYSMAWMDGYKESGTTNADLTVDKRSVEVLTARAQLGTAFKMSEASELELRVGANSRNGSSDNVDASVAGNAFSYGNVGDESVTGAFVGVNLLVATKDNLRLLADVELGGNSDEDSVNGYLRLDYLF